MNSIRAPKPSAPSSKAAQHDLNSWPQKATPSAIPVANIGIFALFVAITLYIVIRASKKNATAAEFFTARPRVHRPAERHRDLR